MATQVNGTVRAIATLTLVAACSACADKGADRAASVDDRTAVQESAQTEGVPMETPMVRHVGAPGSSSPASAELADAPAVKAAANDFATSLGIPPSDVRAVTVAEVTWPDSALGCPAPDELYTQALVPGYAVALTGGGKTASYHTNRGLGGAIVVRRCADAVLVAPGDDPAVLDRVRLDLAGRVPAGTELVLESNGPSGATDLVCPGTPEAPPPSGAAAAFSKVVTDVVFRVGADRHVYRLWNGLFLYCGLAPAMPDGAGTPTFATR